jgi:hypothetical protein
MHYTAITRSTGRRLRGDLELLAAPLVSTRPELRGATLAQVDGALLSRARVVYFVVQFVGGPRASEHVLVPLAALEVGHDPLDGAALLRLKWDPEQLLAQPKFELHGDQVEQQMIIGGPPVIGRFFPATPNVVPPSSAIDRVAAVRGAAAASAIAGLTGAIVGLLATGPLGALSLGTFFAFGGGLAGAIAGGSRDTAADASELEVPGETTVGMWEVRRLEDALRTAMADDSGVRSVDIATPGQESLETRGQASPRYVSPR